MKTMKHVSGNQDSHRQSQFSISVTLLGLDKKSVFVAGTPGLDNPEAGYDGFKIRVIHPGREPVAEILAVDSNWWIGHITVLAPGVREYKVQALINDVPYAEAALVIPTIP